MTWAMAEPSKFGDFFLDGDYVGWKEALRAAFNEKLSQTDKDQYDVHDVPKYVFYVSQKFINITQDEIDHPRAMKPLQEYEQPTKFAIEVENSKRIGSLVKLTARLIAVDSDLKAVIESLEPGVHQFWPIEIVHRDGNAVSGQYFGMRVRQFKDSFMPEFSAPGSFNENGSTYNIFSFTQKNCKGLSFAKSAIESAHLWRERKLKSPELLLSDELRERIQEAGLTIPNVHLVNVI